MGASSPVEIKICVMSDNSNHGIMYYNALKLRGFFPSSDLPCNFHYTMLLMTDN